LQTEKVDTFSLGNVFYAIATERGPYDDQKRRDEAQQLVIAGELPPLDQAFIDSDHPADKALALAMNMCFEYDWRKRASAVEVRDFLREELKHVKQQQLRQDSHEIKKHRRR